MDPVDQGLLQIVSAAAPTSIAEVLSTMQAIDSLLPGSDGIKWFNLLYLMVTKQIRDNPPMPSWNDAAWITRLDVIFADLYFTAISGFLTSSNTPSSWQALLEARHRTDVDRIQFALVGMNAHINHDLSLALLQTNKELNINPTKASPQHADYEHVNNLLEAALPGALQILGTGILGELAQDTGKIGKLLAIWNVRAARDLAWTFADHLRNLSGPIRDVALASQDTLTGAFGRSLLLPIQ